jgi:hypothetical protein
VSGYINEDTGEVACTSHATYDPLGGPWDYMHTQHIVEWQNDMRDALERESTHSDYGILSKDMWLEVNTRIRCDTCGDALDGKDTAMQSRTLFRVKGESLEGITYDTEVRADSAYEAEAELALIMEYDGLTVGILNAEEIADSPLEAPF